MPTTAPGTLSAQRMPVLTARQRLSVLAVAACFASTDLLAQALPSGAQVVNGSAVISQIGKQMTVTNSNGAIINWQQFNIGAGNAVRFEQPSASSSVLNRVLASDPSVILGNLTSNGRVWLVNPAGILVGQGARIDTAAFVASTMNVTNADFLANRMRFETGPAGAGNVVNQGTITTPMGGSVYLIGSNVSNEGIITTPKGETILAAGNTVELIDSATPGVKVEITGAAGNVTNLGEITAEAGRIGIAGVVVKNSGRISASSVVEEGGRIFLRATKKIELAETSRVGADGTAGGSVTAIVIGGGKIAGALLANGEISVQGTGAGGSGGFVETSAAQVAIDDGFRVKTGGGHWLIDPIDFTIATGSGGQTTSGMGASTLQTALGSGSVTIQTDATTAGNGDIFVNAPVSWASANSLTLQAHRNIDVNASLTASGTGTINLQADFISPDGVGKIQQGSSANVISQAAGTVTLRAGNGIKVTVNGTSNVLDAQTTSGSIELEHSSGTLAINSATAFQSLTLSGGTLTGSGAITVSAGGTFAWNSGTFDATAAAVFSTLTGTTTTGTLGTLGANRTWDNSGTVTKTFPGCCSASFTLNGTFNNLLGGLFDLKDDASSGSRTVPGSGTFNNAGTFNKSLHTTVVNDEVFNPAFNNQSTGVVNINSGVISFNGTGTDSAGGSYNVTAGTTLQFGGNRSIASDISGAGTVGFGNGVIGVSGTYNVAGGTYGSSGCCNTTTVTFTGPVSNVGTTLSVTGGNTTLNFSGIASGQATGFANLTSVSNSGNLTFKNGTVLTALTALTVSGGSANLGDQAVSITSLALTGGTLALGAATFANPLTHSAGTLQLNGTSTLNSLTLSGGVLGGSGAVSVTNGLTWTNGTIDRTGSTLIAGTSNWSAGTFTAGVLTNSGTLTIGGTGTSNISGASAELRNSGTILYAKTGGGVFGFSLIGSKLSNLAGGVVDLQSDTALVGFSGGNYGTIDNAGSIIKSSGTSLDLGSRVVVNHQAGSSFDVPSGRTVLLGAGGSFSGSVAGTGVGPTLNAGDWTSTGGNLTGNWQWSGGNISSGTLSNAGTLTIGGTGSSIISGATAELVNSGTILYTKTGGQFGFSLIGSKLTNQAGATIDLQSDITLVGTAGGHYGVLDNSGTITKSAGVSTDLGSRVVFNSLHGSTIDAPSGRNILLSAGASFTGTSTGTGAGPTLNAGNWAGGVGGGTLAGSWKWIGGNINAGTLNNTGTFWISGTGGNQYIDSGAIFNNSGTVIYDKTVGSWMIANLGTFNNLASGTVDLQTSQAIGNSCCNVGIINNYGTFTKTTAGTATIGGGVTFNSFGGSAFSLPSGAVNLQGGGAFSGTTTGGWSGGGSPPSAAGPNLNAGSWTGAGGGGTLAGTWQWSGGNINAGTLTNTGTFWITGTGGNQYIDSAAVLNNSGTVIYDKTVGNWMIANLGVFNNLVGGTVDLRTSQSIGNSCCNVGIVNNLGTFTKTTAGATTIGGGVTFNSNAGSSIAVQAGQLAITDFSTNNGTIDVAATSTFSKAGTFTNAGTISGSGTISSGTLTNNGTIRPGGSNAIGTLSVAGNLTNGAGGVIEIELSGTSTYDQILATTGNVVLGGTIKVRDLIGFETSIGNTFPIVTASAGSVTGTPAFLSDTGGAYTGTGSPSYVMTATQSGALKYVWSGTVNNFWDDPLNWTGNHIPTATELAIIDGAGIKTVEVRSTGGAQSVRGVLFGPTGGYDNLLLSNGSSLAIGVSGMTLPSSSTMTMSSGTLVGVGTLVNSGTVAVSGGTSTIGSGLSNTVGGILRVADLASVGNRSTATLTVTNGFTNLGLIELENNTGNCCGPTIANLNVTVGTLTNAVGATIRSIGPSAPANILNAQVTNLGTIDVQQSLSITNTSRTFTSNAGTLTVASGQKLTVVDGTSLLGSGTVFSGAGTLSLTGTHLLNLGSNLTLPGAGGVVLDLNGGSAVTVTSGTPGTDLIVPTGGTLTLQNDTLGINVDLVNSGTVTASGGTSVIDGGLSNAAGGILRVADLASVGNRSTATLTVTNGFTNLGLIELENNTGNCCGPTIANLNVTAGTLSNAVGATIRSIGPSAPANILNAQVTNLGTIDIQRGLNITTLSANDGTIDFSANNATLSLANGALANNSGGVISGSGVLNLAGGTLTNNGTISPGVGAGNTVTLSITGNLDLAGGTLNIEMGGTGAGQFDKLAVTGNVTMGGTLNAAVTGGYVPVNADALPFLTMGGVASGTFTPGMIAANFSAGYNLAGGEGARMIFSTVGTRTFNNSQANLDWGTALNWTGGMPGAGDTALISGSHAVSHAYGNDSIAALTINAANSVTVSGGSLNVSGLTTLGGTLSVSGSGSAILAGGANGVATGQINLSGGTLTLSAASSVAGFTQTGGLLNGAADLTANSSFYWSSGTMQGAGKTVVGSGVTAGVVHTIDNGYTQPVLERTLENHGTITHESGTAGPFSLTINAGGVLDIKSTGSYVFTSDAGINGTGGVITNSGTFGKTGGTLTSITASFQNLPGGSLLANSGTIALPGFTNDGVITGNATVSVGGGTLINHGTIHPGSAGTAGTLSIAGDLDLTGGVLNIDLAGTGAGQFDKLAVSGNVTMGGTLNASLRGGYTTPVNGDFIPFLTMTGTAGGNFAATGMPANFDAGYNLAANEASRLIFSTTGTKTFLNTSSDLTWGNPVNWSGGAVPGPGNAVLISAGFSVLHPSGNDTIAALTVNALNSLDISGGSLTVSGATSVGGSLSVSGGTLVLNGASSVQTLGMSAGALNGSGNVSIANGFNYSGGTVGLSGALDIAHTGDLSLPAMTSLTSLLANATGHINLIGDIAASGAGNAIVLATGKDFNNSGGHALTASGGRWLVYSQAPATIAKGGLTSAFRHYGSNYGSYAPASVSESGNGFIYASAQPTLTADVSLPGASDHIYGDAPTATYSISLTPSATADNEDIAANFGVNLGAATYRTSVGSLLIDNQLDAGGYLVVANGLSSTLGYTISNGSTPAYSVTQAPLSITANNQSKVYGDTQSFTGTEFIAGGLKNGQTVGGVTLASGGAAPTAGVAGGPYPIVASAATGGSFNPTNYTISYVDGSLAVTQRPLTATFSGQTKPYDGNTSASAAGYTLNNLANSETLTLGGTATFDNRNVGVGKTVNFTGLALANGTGNAGNYSIAASGTGTGSITQLASVNWTGTAGDGKWSTAGNWAGSALPDGANVAAVSLPPGSTVNFDASTQATQLTSIAQGAGGSFVMAGSGLNVSGSVITPSYNQTGGTLNGAGSLTVSSSFAKSGGSLALTGLINIHQAAGVLSIVNNAPLTLGAVDTASGGILIDTSGGIFTTTSPVSATGGALDFVARSPIQVGSGGLSATGNISLTAATASAGSTITMNGPIASSSGSVNVAAYGAVAQNASIQGQNITVASTSGNIAVAPAAVSTVPAGGSIGYSATAGSVTSSGSNFAGATPTISASSGTVGGGATNSTTSSNTNDIVTTVNKASDSLTDDKASAPPPPQQPAESSSGPINLALANQTTGGDTGTFGSPVPESNPGTGGSNLLGTNEPAPPTPPANQPAAGDGSGSGQAQGKTEPAREGAKDTAKETVADTSKDKDDKKEEKKEEKKKTEAKEEKKEERRVAKKVAQCSA